MAVQCRTAGASYRRRARHMGRTRYGRHARPAVEYAVRDWRGVWSTEAQVAVAAGGEADTVGEAEVDDGRLSIGIHCHPAVATVAVGT